jgi:hypothetical protein
MAGTITHSWNGTVLTVTSDSGTSSADLAGTMGPRGPQGPAGVIINGSGTIDMSGYATEKWVNDKIAEVNSGAAVDLTDYYTKSEIDVLLEDLEVDVDLTDYATTGDVAQAVSDKATKTYVDEKLIGYATESFVTTKITEAQLGGGEGGGGIDLSGYATKDDIADMATETYVDDAFKFDWLGSLAGKTITEFRAMLDEWLAANVDKTAKCQFSASDNFINLWNTEDTTSTITEGSRWTCEITSGYLNNSYTVITLSNYYYNKIYTLNKNVTWKPIQEIATINVVSSMIADAIAALDGSEVEY